MMFSGKFFKYFKWVLLILIAAYLLLVVVRVFHFFNLDKTEAQVAKIHATKLSMSDVMGDNLPPDPGIEADKTIEGIDANENGIRDDVELAVFKEYPNSAKTRAVLLQYALALQMEVVQPFINTTIATEVVREQSRGFQCVGNIFLNREAQESFEKLDSLIKSIKDKEFNTEERKNARNIFLEKVRSYSDLDSECDIDISKLTN
ncbi:MAG: hypothetical protein UU10_C0016G0006 [Parcubacteria group bacterium GW2011_GWF1_40_6]|nr:MAG: hypothetical protein UU10_C0016G0006 [Parcubacteria group bacterium GW2011_GWF1_40_6]